MRGRCWWHPRHGAPTRAQTGRESQVLSVRGESIPEERFCQSLCRAVGMWPGARLIDYVCVESSLLGESPPKRPRQSPQNAASTTQTGLGAVGGFNVLMAPLQAPPQGSAPPITRCSWSCGA